MSFVRISFIVDKDRKKKTTCHIMQGRLSLMAVALLVAAACHCVMVVWADVLIFDQTLTLVERFNDLPARFGPLFPEEGKRLGPQSEL